MTQQLVPKNRELSKNNNRKEILLGARKAIIECGFSNATITNIIKRTSLSRGMINLHFNSKNELLLEVVKDFNQEYSDIIESVYNATYPNVSQKLQAIIEVEFEPKIMNEQNVKLWFALRAEAFAYPEFKPYINTRNFYFRKHLIKICEELNFGGIYKQNELKYIVNAINCLLEGFWGDYQLNYDNFNRDHAKKSCLMTLKAFFPQNFHYS